MRHVSDSAISRGLVVTFVVVSFLAGAGPLFISQVAAAVLQDRSLDLSNGTIGATNVTYAASFTLATAGALGSIELQFCANSPLPQDSCTTPSGLDVSSATLTAQSGATGFSVSGSSTANELILTRAPTVSAAVPVSYTLSGITNPSTVGTFYGRLSTYASNNATGAATDTGGVALALTPAVNVQAYVPPYLLFCSGNTISAFDCSTATGDYLDLGNFSLTSTSTGTTQLVAATNGQSGYSINVTGTTLESGNNTIPPLQTPTASQAGTSQFGINLSANTTPQVGSNVSGPGIGTATNGYGTPNEFKYNQNDQIADSPVADDYRKYTVSYLVNIAHGQPVGIYASTFTYVALANF